jgi:hypothetical protein
MEADTLKQFPIYYVSEALSGSKLFYSEMEKMAYAVVSKEEASALFSEPQYIGPHSFPSSRHV